MGRDLRRWSVLLSLVLFTIGCGASLTPPSGASGGAGGTGDAGGAAQGIGGSGPLTAGRDAAIDLGRPDPPPCYCTTCGNGMLDPGERCDDGNKTGGDGCTPLCQIENGWTCPVPGEPCVRIDGGPVDTCQSELVVNWRLEDPTGAAVTCDAAGALFVAVYLEGPGSEGFLGACPAGDSSGTLNILLPANQTSYDITVTLPGSTVDPLAASQPSTLDVTSCGNYVTPAPAIVVVDLPSP